MTANMKALIEDAEKAGYHVYRGSEMIRIVTFYGRWQKQHGLAIYPDGTAVDVTVDCGAAKCIRDYATMREILGL